jgi:hypothetical protein
MKHIGSFPGSFHEHVQVAQNSNRSLSSNTLNKKVVALFNRLTTTDGQGESKMFDNVSTDTLERTGRE